MSFGERQSSKDLSLHLAWLLFTIRFMTKILVTGAFGQIGSELVPTLQKMHGTEAIIALGHKNVPDNFPGIVEAGDVTDLDFLKTLINTHHVDTIYHLAALLSVVSEQKPQEAWQVNVIGLKNILDIAKEKKIRVFWPSSIAVFGPTTPKENTPQTTIIEPTTMYGVNKLIGESLCHYYYLKYGLDVRSVRYPGLLDYKTPPSLGTSEYAKEIFWKAIKDGYYEAPLRADTRLPMMYMLDAIRATNMIMHAPEDKINVRTSYNISAISFTPEELATEIKKYVPELTIKYKETEIQPIADSWPDSIDDSQAEQDWDWSPEYNLSSMVKEMYEHIKQKIEHGTT